MSRVRFAFISIILTTVIASAAHQAIADDGIHGGCFEKHLKDAISNNDLRRPIYSQMTSGKSEAISDLFIKEEARTLSFARYLDKKARPFQKSGMPVMCEDFISMKTVPAVPEKVTYEFVPSKRPELPKHLIEKLFYAYRTQGSLGVRSFIQKLNENELKDTRFNCMTRHVLDSIVRSSEVGDYFSQMASASQLPNPKRLYEINLNAQIAGLYWTEQLDELAFPIQASGVSIICSDIPVIPEFQFR